MKFKIQIILLLLIVVLSFFTANPVTANEGRIVLKSGNIDCQGISIWERTSYQVVGKCFGLIYPYDEQLDTYILWGRLENGQNEQITEIDRGMYDGLINDRFNSLYITAEADSSPDQPGRVIVSGNLEKFPNINDTAMTSASPLPTGSATFFATPSATKFDVLNVSKTITRTTIYGLLLIGGIMLVLFLLVRRK